IPKEELQSCFPEFRPYVGCCRFDDCAHLREPGCAVLEALREGNIAPSRHESYEKLYAISAGYKDWENKK
ncbi:MAG: ribosome small subunit-dependent GTPase A, partial [Oscillospiraceae bacterium]|nr:ribosome small subunit-dependent GTPase A [Oscillospiraceae bacterium]